MKNSYELHGNTAVIFLNRENIDIADLPLVQKFQGKWYPHLGHNMKWIIMKFIRFVAGWMVWNIPCGKLAPHLMGFYLGCKPARIK